MYVIAVAPLPPRVLGTGWLVPTRRFDRNVGQHDMNPQTPLESIATGLGRYLHMGIAFPNGDIEIPTTVYREDDHVGSKV